MQNIQIIVEDENYIVVRANAKRFGDGAVMFEGNTFDECFNYITRETGREHLPLQSTLACGIYTDRAGRTFPPFMSVLI